MPFIAQIKHNEDFYTHTCAHFPENYHDWKVTIIFYISIHYVKALANQLGIDIGATHGDIRKNIKPPDRTDRRPSMAFSKNAYELYDYLYVTSKTSRYVGFLDRRGAIADNATFQAIMAEDHKMCLEALDRLKRYIIESRGLIL